MQAAGRLHRNYFFEFAGMPQSGKSTIEQRVADILRENKFVVEEYRGGSRYSPLRSSSIASLNFLLACKASEFVITESEREHTAHRIFLLDRGLIDRCMFTDTLLRQQKIDATTANATKNFLTSSAVLQKIDGVFAFVTTPEMALSREKRERPGKPGGEVMNMSFLSSMRPIVETNVEWARTLLIGKPVQLIDTGTENDGNEIYIAQDIADTILRIVHQSFIRSKSR